MTSRRERKVHGVLTAYDMSLGNIIFSPFRYRETLDKPNTTRWALMPHGMDNFILFKSNKHDISKKSVTLGDVFKCGADGKEKQQMTFLIAQIPILDTLLQNEYEKLELLEYL